MANINGFEIIAHNRVSNGLTKGTIVLGHRANPHTDHEYVVATVKTLTDVQWDSGFYSTGLRQAYEFYVTHGGA